MKEISERLNRFFDDHLPITDYLGMRVEEYDGTSLTLYAPLGPSLNDKLTAFGGSLYCLCVMSAWGVVYLKSLERGLKGANIMVSSANIIYRAPVDTAIRAVCIRPPDDTWEKFFHHFEEKGKAKIKLTSSIEVEGKTAVTFEGEYVIAR